MDASPFCLDGYSMKKMWFRGVLCLGCLFFSLVGSRSGRAGMVTLVFDDGLSSVFQYAFPVLSRYGLPATVGLIANRVASGDADFMAVRQAQALVHAGWEMASHSLTHKRPVDIPKFYNEEECVNLRPVAGQRALFEGKYRYEALSGLVENGKRLRERANGRLVRQERGSYYFDELIGELVVHPYEPDSVAKKAIRAISYERELEESKKALVDLGFAISTYITPHNYWTPEMSALSRRFYAQVADGGDGANRRGQTDRFWLKRFVVHSGDSAEDIIDLVKRHAVQEDGWVIFCMHGIGSELGWEPWSVEKLAKLCAYLKHEAVAVVTVEKGAKLWFAAKGKAGI